MDTNEYLIQLEAVRKTGPPMDAFIAVNRSINPDGIEIHPLLLELLHSKKFAGTDEESPYGHLQFFEDICGSFMFDNCNLDKVKIQLFGQTLSHNVCNWYRSFCAEAPRTWMELTTKFLSKYYSESKAHRMRGIIISFKNNPDESLYEGYLRYKSYLIIAPIIVCLIG
jgi:hypothetical protein